MTQKALAGGGPAIWAKSGESGWSLSLLLLWSTGDYQAWEGQTRLRPPPTTIAPAVPATSILLRLLGLAKVVCLRYLSSPRKGFSLGARQHSSITATALAQGPATFTHPNQESMTVSPTWRSHHRPRW